MKNNDAVLDLLYKTLWYQLNMFTREVFNDDKKDFLVELEKKQYHYIKFGTDNPEYADLAVDMVEVIDSIIDTSEQIEWTLIDGDDFSTERVDKVIKVGRKHVDKR